MMKTKFIIVTGGMISGVGKGVAAASIGKILSAYGYKTTLIKIDPYLNCDAGTLRPTEHGEVWVTADGGEIDQDLGTYERFLGIDIPKKNSITTGQIYQTVIDRERQGYYLGQTVQFIPHIIDEIIGRIKDAAQGFECAVIEIGGTLGDDENKAFLLTSKLLSRECGAHGLASVLVSYLPVPVHVGEMKTKPTQQAARILSEQGVFPDFIICRSHIPIDQTRKEKIAQSTHVPVDRLIGAPDISSIYEMPLIFEQQGFGSMLLTHFDLAPRIHPDWKSWSAKVSAMKKGSTEVTIGMVGKYTHAGDFNFADSYISIYHALMHAAATRGVKISVVSIDAELLVNQKQAEKLLGNLDAVVVPGGFGATGVEGKIEAIRYVREHNIPFLGICYGMQLATIEYARNVCRMDGAHTTEVDEKTLYPVVTTLPYQRELISAERYGGTMRLGSYRASVLPGSLVYRLYGATSIVERHRHRYEINPEYVDILNHAGLSFSAVCVREDGTRLMECIELPGHTFFVGIQAHPEFMSRFDSPHPLFVGLINAALEQSVANRDQGTVYDKKHNSHVEQRI